MNTEKHKDILAILSGILARYFMLGPAESRLQLGWFISFQVLTFLGFDSQMPEGGVAKKIKCPPSAPSLQLNTDRCIQ